MYNFASHKLRLGGEAVTFSDKFNIKLAKLCFVLHRCSHVGQRCFVLLCAA